MFKLSSLWYFVILVLADTFIKLFHIIWRKLEKELKETKRESFFCFNLIRLSFNLFICLESTLMNLNFIWMNPLLRNLYLHRGGVRKPSLRQTAFSVMQHPNSITLWENWSVYGGISSNLCVFLKLNFLFRACIWRSYLGHGLHTGENK